MNLKKIFAIILFGHLTISQANSETKYSTISLLSNYRFKSCITANTHLAHFIFSNNARFCLSTQEEFSKSDISINQIKPIEISKSIPFYKTPSVWFLLALIQIVIISIIVYIIFYRKKNKKLHELIKAKSVDLARINEELELNKIEILAQKGELEIHRNYLEETVERRTADFEKAKIKAEESDKLKTAFLANLSHEIRTPMNAIVGFSSLLNTNMFSLKEQKEFIDLIMASSETLLVLIDDILDISRIETSQVNITQASINIENFTNQLYQALASENHNDDISFTIEVHKELENIEITTDPIRLRQIITNLVSNALKFTSSGHIKIVVKKEFYALLKNKGFSFKNPIPVEEEVLFISVEDSGIGIAPKNLEIIFEPFRKLDNANQELFGGIGLGLSIVKKLCLLLGGEVQVKSELGQGSNFYFYLPLTNLTYIEGSSENYDNFEEEWM